MTRSFPEKTFEHWCSMHLAYRYRAGLQMWWPTHGEDVRAYGGPLAPGKRVLLELKTTEWNAAAQRHDLSIDLDQLARYAVHGGIDYYVFPKPEWIGVLGSLDSFPWLDGLLPTELAYQSKSGEQWFSEWTRVVSGNELRQRLRPRRGQKKKRIAEMDTLGIHWVDRALTGLQPLTWKAFWQSMEACGAPNLPAMFIVPKVLSPGGFTDRAALRSALAYAAENRTEYADLTGDDIELFVPAVKGRDTGGQSADDDIYELVPEDASALSIGEARTDLNLGVALLRLDGLRL